MKKKILILVIVLLALIGLTLFVGIKSRPKTQKINPLASVDPSTWGKIELKSPDHALTLEQGDSKWELTSPVKDQVEERLIKNLIKTLSDFRVGSIVSENKERFGKFGLEEKKSIRVKVYLRGRSEPTLDGFVGDTASSFQDSYFHFNGRERVQIAKDLPRYYLQRSAEDYRLNALLPVQFESLTAIHMKFEKSSYSLSRSSAAWINEETSKGVETSWVNTLNSRLRSLRSSEFLDEEKPLADLGLEKPPVWISLSTSSGTIEAFVGGVVKNKASSTVKRYAKTKDRPAILILAGNLIDSLRDHLNTLPK